METCSYQSTLGAQSFPYWVDGEFENWHPMRADDDAALVAHACGDAAEDGEASPQVCDMTWRGDEVAYGPVTQMHYPTRSCGMLITDCARAAGWVSWGGVKPDSDGLAPWSHMASSGARADAEGDDECADGFLRDVPVFNPGVDRG